MLKVADFLAQLDEQEHLALVNNLGGGLHGARLAAQCVTEAGRHAEKPAAMPRRSRSCSTT